MILNDVHRGINRKYKKRKRHRSRAQVQGHGKTCWSEATRARDLAEVPLAKPTFQGGTMPLVRRVPEAWFQQSLGAAPWPSSTSAKSTRPSEAGEEVSSNRWPPEEPGRGRFRRAEDFGRRRSQQTKLKISAHRFSKSALEKIEKAGGEMYCGARARRPFVKSRRRKSKSRTKKEATATNDEHREFLTKRAPH